MEMLHKLIALLRGRHSVTTPHRLSSTARWWLLALLLPVGGQGCNQGTSSSPERLELVRVGSQAPQYIVYATSETGPSNYVRALKLDGDTLWVGTSHGIIIVNQQSGELIQTVTRATSGNQLVSDYIFTINVDPRGVKWFGTNNGGLSRFDPTAQAGYQWKSYLPAHGLADFWVYDLDYAADGTMWVGTWDGVSHYDPRADEGNEFTNYNEEDGLANRWVYTVAVDHDQSVWLGTEAGVSRFDLSAPEGKQWRTWRHEDGLGASNVLALKRSENTGMGTLPAGEAGVTSDYPTRHDLSVLDEGGNETYNENYVFSIAIDRSGVKWIGTWGGGLSRFDSHDTTVRVSEAAGQAQWRNYTTDDGLAGNIVYAVDIDGRNVLWIGTNHGLSRFDPQAKAGEQWQRWGVEEGLLGEDVYAVAAAPSGSVWIGQKGGVIEVRPMPQEID